MAPISFSEPSPTQKHPIKTVTEVNEVFNNEESTQTVKNPSQIPIVVLDVDYITDAIAARLATSLLGHVLFLKNQIPLPIIQLARMPGRSNTKVAKLKADLLSSYDTLASHLVTTFSALSTALAQCDSADDRSTSRVYLAILVGPSLGTAKSKVIYGVDSFATQVWGKRDDLTSEDHWSGEEFPEESEDEDSGGSTNSELRNSHEAIADSTPDGIEHESDDKAGGSDECDEDGSDEEGEAVGEGNLPSPLQYRSYAEEQRFLQAADRLLSRTLASADAEGHAISNEMAPSQTHILIQAPRRFTHPAWVPRQNLTKQMEAVLISFLEESWRSPNNDRVGVKKKRVEGVWVTTKKGLRHAAQLHKGDAIHEDDELIWWSWEGKFIGFADW